MAGAAAGASNSAKLCNFVAQDQIWKDHVHHEEVASKNWPDKWNFLSTKYEDLVADQFPDSERKKAKKEDIIKLRTVTPIEEYIKVDPSPKPFPKTTSSGIGWRSTVPTLKLEKYGGYAKPKGGLVKQLNWPTEGIN